MTELCRSALYVPAINTRAIEKSRSIDADAVVYDLEDSVAPDQKATARQQLVETFNEKRVGTRVTLIRSNPIGSGDYLDDLHTIRDCNPHALLLPKVSTVTEVETFAKDAKSADLPAGMATWFMIESAAGIANLAELIEAGVNTRWPLAGLVVGHNDLALETGVSLADDRRYLIPWLMQIILYAKNSQLLVLDSVWNNFKDTQGFEREAQQAKAMGFDGKSLIHPAQVEIANQVFAPSADEIAAAQAIVAAFADPANSSAGVINLNGEMVERLHLEQARRLLARV
jgi:citrate lyase subunit beta/citryl-CoA lyase